jgi:hypothetical protein
MSVSNADLLGGPLPYEDVPTPEITEGATVRVRCLTALEKDQYDQAFWYTPEGSLRPVFDAAGARARLLRLACINPDGSHRFTDDDLPALRNLRADVADRLFAAAQRLMGSHASIEEMKQAFVRARSGSGSTR